MKKTCLFLLLIVTAKSALSQSFQNLNFEQARVVSLAGGHSPYSIATSNAVPGWNVLFGNVSQTEMTVNAPSTGSTWANLWATNGQNLDGNFSILLQGAAAESAISQTGFVPVSAQSLTFRAQAGLGSLDLSLGGVDVPFFILSSGPNYTLYAADVSGFAGQVEQLTFTALPGVNSQLNNWNIDDIQFSSAAVPEPSTLALAGIGGGLIALRLRRKLGVK